MRHQVFFKDFYIFEKTTLMRRDLLTDLLYRCPIKMLESYVNMTFHFMYLQYLF